MMIRAKLPLLLGDHPGAGQVVVDGAEHAGRDGQVVDAVAAGAVGAIELLELLAEAREVRRVLELARHVVEAAGEVGPDRLVDGLAPRELRDRVAHGRPELLLADVGEGEADDRHARREQARDREVVERRDQLAARQVPGGAEDDEHARRRVRARSRVRLGKGCRSSWLRRVGRAVATCSIRARPQGRGSRHMSHIGGASGAIVTSSVARNPCRS